MDDSTKLTNALVENATTAQSVSSAAGSVSSHSPSEIIKARLYLASENAARRGSTGLRTMRREGNTSG